MVTEAVVRIKHGFNVEIIDYERPGAGVLITGGSGFGLAMMDVVPRLRYFLDVDDYPTGKVCWESLAIVLTCARPSVLVVTGGFLMTDNKIFDALQRGCVNNVPFHRYTGDTRGITLKDFIEKVLQHV